MSPEGLGQIQRRVKRAWTCQNRRHKYKIIQVSSHLRFLLQKAVKHPWPFLGKLHKIMSTMQKSCKLSSIRMKPIVALERPSNLLAKGLIPKASKSAQWLMLCRTLEHAWTSHNSRCIDVHRHSNATKEQYTISLCAFWDRYISPSSGRLQAQDTREIF